MSSQQYANSIHLVCFINIDSYQLGKLVDLMLPMVYDKTQSVSKGKSNFLSTFSFNTWPIKFVCFCLFLLV